MKSCMLWNPVASLVVAGCVMALSAAAQPAVAEGPASPESSPAADVNEQFTELYFDSENGLRLVSGRANVIDLVTTSHGNPFGVEVATVGEALRSQLKIEGQTGVVVTSVTPETAAAKAGIQPHDVILRIDSDPVKSSEQFHEVIGRRKGETVTVGLLRQGQATDLSVELPDVPVYSLITLPGPAEQRYRIGVTLAEADETLRSQLNLAAGEGLVVTDVVADSPASRAGLREHDVLTKLDGKRLTTVESANTQIQEVQERTVTVDFLRRGGEMLAEITPQLSSESRLRWSVGDVSVIKTTTPLVRNYIKWSHAVQEQQPAAAGADDQLVRLRQQLAEMQRTLEALETSLHAAPQQEPANPSDED